MSEDDRSNPPMMSPTQKAKAQGQVPRGGAAPVIQNGPAQVQQQPLSQQPRGPQGVTMQQLSQQLSPEGVRQQSTRSPQEIQVDMQRLAEGIKRVTVKDEEEPEEKKDEEEVGSDDDLSGWLSDPKSADLFTNAKYKKRIEGRIEKMDVESLIMHGEVVQIVPVLVKKGTNQPRLTATFRSISAMEDLAIKRQFYDEEGPDRFMIDRYSLMNLCLGLRALNSTDQPLHLDENGKFDKDAFKKKFDKMLKMPYQLLALLVVNYVWFDERVRKLLVADELGNG